jgi:hypothetical protein
LIPGFSSITATFFSALAHGHGRPCANTWRRRQPPQRTPILRLLRHPLTALGKSKLPVNEPSRHGGTAPAESVGSILNSGRSAPLD